MSNLFINLVEKLDIFAHVSGECTRNVFLGIPTWYKYLHTHGGNDKCAPLVRSINDFWLIGLAIIEILTRIAVFAAIAFVIYAGVKYSASRGNVDKVNSAKFTLLDALTGLIIAIAATAAVSFIAGRISQN